MLSDRLLLFVNNFDCVLIDDDNYTIHMISFTLLSTADPHADDQNNDILRRNAETRKGMCLTLKNFVRYTKVFHMRLKLGSLKALLDFTYGLNGLSRETQIIIFYIFMQYLSFAFNKTTWKFAENQLPSHFFQCIFMAFNCD